MNNLVYFVCFGKPFFYKLCQLAVDSVRKVGFDGDIVVLSALPHDFKGAQTIVLSNKFEHKYDPHMCRARIHEYVDMSKYDVVLYLDTDVIALRDLTPIFDMTAENRKFNVFSAPTRIHRLWHTSTMSKESVGKNINRNTPSICSGIYSYPADLVEQFNKIWLDLFSKSSSHPEIFVCDQNVLCELLYENYEPYTLLPDEWLYYPKYHKGERGSELLIHHCAVSRYRTKYKYLEDRLSEVPDDNKKAWDK